MSTLRASAFITVRSSAEINWLFQRNIQFLEDYLRTTPEVGSFHGSGFWLRL